tara:strand:+ start:345 stop:770 length:426 start_codon:yes stop_codon:yes gene_type:complete
LDKIKKMNKVKATKLLIIDNDKGPIMRALRMSDNGYKKFGEIYFSEVFYGKIKGWKRHIQMTMNLVVPEGLVKFVFYDPNLGSFEEYEIGTNNYIRLTVPPGLWFAFQGLEKKNLVMNVSDIEHDPIESENKNISEIKYSW